jgi:hypothetical protein
MFQVGYHPRGGVEGFLSHTYVPGLRFRVDGELISESHVRAWASGVPLLGITGNDLHQQTLGSLSRTPFLVTQTSLGRSAISPVWDEPEDGRAAIREFAERCARDAAPVGAQDPTAVTFEASMPNGGDVVGQMTDAGWTRFGEVEFSAHLRTWRDARELVSAAMDAALAPFLPYWLGGFDSADAAAAADQRRVQQLRVIFDAWAEESQPQWYTEAVDPLPSGVREHLAQD